jgi:hypothetical protein
MGLLLAKTIGFLDVELHLDSFIVVLGISTKIYVECAYGWSLLRTNEQLSAFSL